MTPSRNGLATFRLVGQCFNQLGHRVLRMKHTRVVSTLSSHYHTKLYWQFNDHKQVALQSLYTNYHGRRHLTLRTVSPTIIYSVTLQTQISFIVTWSKLECVTSRGRLETAFWSGIGSRGGRRFSGVSHYRTLRNGGIPMDRFWWSVRFIVYLSIAALPHDSTGSS